MAQGTEISWTDSTWNPITGCSVISAGCKNCYAMKLAGTRLKHQKQREGLTIDTARGPVWNGIVRFNEEWLTLPLQWRKPQRIFVCAHADLFHESVPDAWIDKVFAVMALAPQHIFQVLTKRPKRMFEYLTWWPEGAARRHHVFSVLHTHLVKDRRSWSSDDREFLLAKKLMQQWPLPNVWLGTSAEDQPNFDERWPWLQRCPAAVRWVSLEPLLGPIDAAAALDIYRYDDTSAWAPRNAGSPHDTLDWVVVGGESGNGARPMHPDWVYDLRDQCAAASVPFHFKQWGNWIAPGHEEFGRRAGDRITHMNHAGLILDPPPQDENADCLTMVRVSKKRAGRTLSLRTYDDYPEHSHG